MAIDFPVSPSVGQQYTYQGTTYVFSAQGVWVQVAGGSGGLGIGIIQQRFTANGIYIPSLGLLFAIAELVGGGGGSGGVPAPGLSILAASGGASAGTYTISRLTAAQIGASQVVTIGPGGVGGAAGANPGTNGGATSLGALCTAPGGLLSAAGVAGSAGVVAIVGGSSPAAGVGDLSVPGGAGGLGLLAGSGTASQSAGCGGFGGSSYFGAGGKQTPATNGTGVAGSPGTGFGSGGSGACSFNSAGATAAGGNGAPGYMVITEYIGVASSGGGGGGVSTSFSPPQGRLTLQTLTPVMTSNLITRTSIFYTPYEGNQIPLFNGTGMVMTAFAELTVLTTDTVNSPAAIGASKVNDWFVWDSGGGVLRLVHGPDWTNDGTRSAGTALVRVNGLWLNAVAITNGPAIQRGTYVGTTRSDAGSTLNWVYGGIAPGGGAGLFGVWNCYNRVDFKTQVRDDTNSWTLASGTVQAANNASSMRVSFVCGIPEDEFQAQYACTGSTSGSGYFAFGVGIDVTTAFSGQSGFGNPFATSAIFPAFGTAIQAFTGFHFMSAVETQQGGGTGTFFGDAGSVGAQNGLTWQGRM